MDFLIGSPFSSPVGQLIQKATRGSLEGEDWGMNMEICDIINETEDGPKNAVKAIKKRLVGNKNFREVMLSLTVLETCVKNCGHRFHVHVCTRNFVEGVLVRTILPKNNPPMVLHDRVLSLIQAWADAFRNVPSLSGVVCVYDDLKKRGLEFPMTDLDALSPIHTPIRSIPEDSTPNPPAAEPTAHTPNVANTHTLHIPQTNGAPAPISPEQKQKLRAELDLVKGNLMVMTEMLNQLRPGESSPSDTELLQQLYSVCKSMQKRVVELIPSLCEEELIGELLVINDDLNNAFIRYERFERLSTVQRTPTEQQVAGDLIDLGPVSAADNQTLLPPVSQPATRPTNNPTMSAASGDDDEFDMFAQTRGSSLAEQRKSVRYEDPGAVEGLAEALDTRLQVTAGRECVKDEAGGWCRQSQWIYSEALIPAPQSAAMDDIEKWLSSEPFNDDDDEEGVTSEEFDKFLAQRAKAVEHLPSVQKSSSTPGNSQQSAQKQESTQDQLFTL
ncbi:target of Myb1 membrane trafficking protein isoform X1 [Pangasianodon hypophthalmus]|uniref:target of Myb1 membrane trafficking protein isoform X1 n=1 Tax=Pangasianodon hypophthalmus TaxID=310915 RepID=UPI0023081045|nr:target of Myb1 membrane trafficking protein isoform X1 [Pangasianodon hypophthalmus]